MRLKVDKDIETLRRIIIDYYSDYNIITDSKVNQDTYFIVVEKFFLRNSSRASLSIVIAKDDFEEVVIEAVGSGGGNGWLFKFDWGAKESFEYAIIKILKEHSITFTEE